MRAAAGAVGERLRHESRDHAVLVRDLARGHLDEGEVVRGFERIGIGEIDLELAVAVLVIDLVHIDPDGAQPGHHFIQHLARAVQPLVVVAGLVEIIGGIRRSQGFRPRGATSSMNSGSMPVNRVSPRSLRRAICACSATREQ